MQDIITFIVVAAAVLYTSWRIYTTLRGESDPCDGCELKKNCRKFGQSKEK